MAKIGLDRYFGTDSMFDKLELYVLLHGGIFALRDIGIHKRVISHWADEGILLSEREESKKRRFSFVEYVWLKAVAELREIGVGLEIIKKAKEELFKITPNKDIYRQLKENPDKINNIPDEKIRNELTDFLNSKEFEEMDEEFGYSEFFTLIYISIVAKEPTSIILFTDGKILPLSNLEFQYYKKESLERILFDTHITVSISKIIKEFLISEDSVFVLPKLKIIGSNELKVLEILSSGEYDTVTINFKNRKMKSLQLVKEQDVRRKIVDILTENSYQDIVIKSHGGIITRIQNTHKVFFD